MPSESSRLGSSPPTATCSSACSTTGTCTSGGDGSPQDKTSLIEARLSGNMRLAKLEEQELEVVVEGTTGITRVTVALTGRTQDVLYSMRVVVTRTWTRTERGWTVLAERLSVVEPRDFTVTATAEDEAVPRSPGRLRRV